VFELFHNSATYLDRGKLCAPDLRRRVCGDGREGKPDYRMPSGTSALRKMATLVGMR
jgi:hypothetical protein